MWKSNLDENRSQNENISIETSMQILKANVDLQLTWSEIDDEVSKALLHLRYRFAPPSSILAGNISLIYYLRKSLVKMIFANETWT